MLMSINNGEKEYCSYFSDDRISRVPWSKQWQALSKTSAVFFFFVTNVITIHSVDDDANEISFIFPPVSN